MIESTEAPETKRNATSTEPSKKLWRDTFTIFDQIKNYVYSPMDRFKKRLNLAKIPQIRIQSANETPSQTFPRTRRKRLLPTPRTPPGEKILPEFEEGEANTYVMIYQNFVQPSLFANFMFPIKMSRPQLTETQETQRKILSQMVVFYYHPLYITNLTRVSQLFGYLNCQLVGSRENPNRLIFMYQNDDSSDNWLNRGIS